MVAVPNQGNLVDDAERKADVCVSFTIRLSRDAIHDVYTGKVQGDGSCGNSSWDKSTDIKVACLTKVQTAMNTYEVDNRTKRRTFT